MWLLLSRRFQGRLVSLLIFVSLSFSHPYSLFLYECVCVFKCPLPVDSFRPSRVNNHTALCMKPRPNRETRRFASFSWRLFFSAIDVDFYLSVIERRVQVFIIVFQPIRVIQCTSCLYCRCSLKEKRTNKNERKEENSYLMLAMLPVQTATSSSRAIRRHIIRRGFSFLPSFRFTVRFSPAMIKYTRRLTRSFIYGSKRDDIAPQKIKNMKWYNASSKRWNRPHGMHH